MNVITETRNRLKDLLESAGLSVSTFEPDRISAPQVIITAGNPYLEQGDTFSTDTLHLRLVCIVRTGADSVVQKDIDDLIIKVTDALANERALQSYSVQAPMTLVAENFTAPAVEIHTTLTIERT